MIRLAPAVIAAAFVALAGAATAQDAGRFTFGADGEAVLRIDTVTGAVSRCVPAAEGWLCTPVATVAAPETVPVLPASPAAPDLEAELARITALLGDLQEAVAALAARPAGTDLGPAIEMLRQQMEALAAAQQTLAANLAPVAGPTIAGPPAPGLEPRLAAIETAIAGLGERIIAFTARNDLILPALADLVERQRAVVEAVALLPPVLEAQLTPLLSVQSQQTALLRQTITELFGARQADAAAANAALADQLARIEVQIAALPATDPAAAAALATEIEALAQHLAEANGVLPPELATLLNGLRDQQAAMDARLATLVAGQPVLTDTVGALAAQIAATMANDAGTARTLAAITENVLALRQDVAILAELGGAAPAPGALTGIAERLAAIETEIRALGGASDNDLAAALGALTDRLAALEARIGAIPPALDAAAFNETAGAIRTDIGTLQQAVARVVETIAGEEPDPAIAAVRLQLAELVAAQHGMLAQLPERVAATPEILAAVEGLQTRLAALETRIAGMGTAEQATAILGALGTIVEGQAGIEAALAAPATPPADIGRALDAMTRRLADLEALLTAAPAAVDPTATLAALGDRLTAIEGRLSALTTPSNGDALIALRTDVLALRDQVTALTTPPPPADLTPLVNQLLDQQGAMTEAIRILADEIATMGGTIPPAVIETAPRADAQPAPPPAAGFGENLMQRLFGLADDLRGGLN